MMVKNINSKLVKNVIIVRSQVNNLCIVVRCQFAINVVKEYIMDKNALDVNTKFYM